MFKLWVVCILAAMLSGAAVKAQEQDHGSDCFVGTPENTAYTQESNFSYDMVGFYLQDDFSSLGKVSASRLVCDKTLAFEMNWYYYQVAMAEYNHPMMSDNTARAKFNIAFDNAIIKN